MFLDQDWSQLVVQDVLVHIFQWSICWSLENQILVLILVLDETFDRNGILRVLNLALKGSEYVFWMLGWSWVIVPGDLFIVVAGLILLDFTSVCSSSWIIVTVLLVDSKVVLSVNRFVNWYGHVVNITDVGALNRLIILNFTILPYRCFPASLIVDFFVLKISLLITLELRIRAFNQFSERLDPSIKETNKSRILVLDFNLEQEVLIILKWNELRYEHFIKEVFVHKVNWNHLVLIHQLSKDLFPILEHLVYSLDLVANSMEAWTFDVHWGVPKGLDWRKYW